jgi:hypothetical protein
MKELFTTVFLRPIRRSPRLMDPLMSHVDALLHSLHRKVNLIMATQAELAADLRSVTTQVAKIGVETGNTLARVVELEALLSSTGATTPEVDEAVAALKAQAQLTDDLVPDAIVTP